MTTRKKGHTLRSSCRRPVRVTPGSCRMWSRLPLVENEDMFPDTGKARQRDVHFGFIAAAVFGTVHAGFSLYWAAGGTWLLWSLGSGLLETFAGREWLLFPIGAVKLIAALAPWILARLHWPWPRLTRGLCWLGSVALIAWGGLNTVVGNLVLTGIIQPGDGFDRPGMIGHAWMWDPLFLLWGVALLIGLLATRSPKR